MITRKQVADLQPGDVVELRSPQGAVVSGTLEPYGVEAGLTLGSGLAVRRSDGEPLYLWADNGWSLTVVSRAPRPLYVNSDRTEPKHGDIVVDEDGDAWQRRGNQWFLALANGRGVPDISDCAPLTLLWDGETGLVVQ